MLAKCPFVVMIEGAVGCRGVGEGRDGVLTATAILNKSYDALGRGDDGVWVIQGQGVNGRQLAGALGHSNPYGEDLAARLILPTNKLSSHMPRLLIFRERNFTRRITMSLSSSYTCTK